MRRFIIHPNVISVPKPNGVLNDKTKSYPENTWPPKELGRLLEGGFIVEEVAVIETPEIEETPEETTEVEETEEPKGNKKKR